MSACPYESRDPDRPCQGSVYRDVRALVCCTPVDPSAHFTLEEWEFPYAVAMSQECDLYQDHERRRQEAKEGSAQSEQPDHDKLLPSVLMCPAYHGASLREGAHLDALGRRMPRQNSAQWNWIKTNQNPRYHYLASWVPLQVPELVIDFKHFFTIPTEVLRTDYTTEEHNIARLGCLYREDLSQRFTAYLARVGLPVPHHRVVSAPGTSAPDAAV